MSLNLHLAACDGAGARVRAAFPDISGHGARDAARPFRRVGAWRVRAYCLAKGVMLMPPPSAYFCRSEAMNFAVSLTLSLLPS